MKNHVVYLALLVSLVCIGTPASSQEKLSDCNIVPYEKLDVKPELDLGKRKGYSSRQILHKVNKTRGVPKGTPLQTFKS